MGEAIVENVSSLVHIRNANILNRNLCILELEFLNPIHYTLNHFLEIPSIPRNTKVTFVNQSAVKLTWQLPEVTGYHTDVYYDVECRNTCNDDDEENCDETACRGQVSYLPSKQGLHETQVLITRLSSFVTYEFRIYARNRVSGVAQKLHGVVGNFALYRVTTNASSESVCFLFVFLFFGERVYQIIESESIRKQQEDSLPLFYHRNFEFSFLTHTEHSFVVLRKLPIMPLSFANCEKKQKLVQLDFTSYFVSTSTSPDGAWRKIEAT